MNQEHIHEALDGDRPAGSLTEAERARMRAIEGTVGEVTSYLRAVEMPDLTARVMASLPAPLPTSARARAGDGLWAWLWRPLTVHFRPGVALGGFAMAMLALVIALPSLEPQGPAVAAADPALYVQFRLDAPGASRVEVAGSFTDWQPEHQMREIAPGVWTIMVPLQPGVHDYTFLVDGERMVVDPYAPSVEDSFGGSNSRLFLPAPNDRA